MQAVEPPMLRLSTFGTILSAIAVLATGHAAAANIQCKLSLARCIRTQGTEIPSKQVLEMLDRCRDFVQGDLGRLAMRLSSKEILDRSAGKPTPLLLAWDAYGYLIDSPLEFERKPKAEEANYAEIKRSCQFLERDFNTESKWTQ